MRGELRHGLEDGFEVDRIVLHLNQDIFDYGVEFMVAGVYGVVQSIILTVLDEGIVGGV